MARPKMFRRPFAMRWTPLEETLVGYYAQKFGKDQAAIVRSMVRKFARADTSLDRGQLTKYFQEHVLPQIQGDPEAVTDAHDLFRNFWASVDPKP